MALLQTVIAAGFAAGSCHLAAQAVDRRLLAEDKAVPPALSQAAQSVAFLDSVPVDPGDEPDGGSAILISDCLVLTANHVVEALSSGKEAAMLRLRFPSLKDDEGRVKTFAATLEERPNGLWRDPVADDWALLRLAETPQLDPIALAPAKCCDWQKLPVPAAVAGFPADRLDPGAPAAWVDPACSIIRRLPIPVLATNCQATSGNSGGPVLIQSEEGWKLAAMLTRAPPPKRRGFNASQVSYALVVEGRIARAIARAKDRPCAVPEPSPGTAPA